MRHGTRTPGVPLLVLVFAVAIGPVPAAWAQAGDARAGRLVPAEIELVGPLEEVVLELEGLGRTTVEVELAEGERRRLSVPLPGRPLNPSSVPRVVRPVEGVDPGRVRFLAWGPAPARPDPLLTRGTPGTGRRKLRIGPRSALALALVWVGVLALRRRPRLALVSSALGSLLLLPLVRAESPREPASVRVLEGRSEAGGPAAWWELRVGRGALVELPPGPATPYLETRPRGLPLGVRQRPEPGASLAPCRVEALPGSEPEDGCWLLARGSFAAGGRVLEPPANRWGDLVEVWTRSTDGLWRAHGPWPVGDPLPPVRPGSQPPGWGVAGLPMGVGVLLALEAPDPAGGPPTWVRLVGFEAP